MPLLQTKLHSPSPHPDLVSRPRLIEYLNAGLPRKLALISAPAGFGKTTLVCDWLRQIDQPAAWLSLDGADNDPARFFTYCLAALQHIEPAIGQTTHSLLQSPQPPAPEALITTLINDSIAFSGKLALVLDDYHHINNPAIHQAMTLLLEHLPPQMRLIITTRADPPLPLARLRVRGQITELRENDLRFTLEEATAFLNEMMALNLTETHIATLESRTEGWIAGLQLAALSVQQQAHPEQFIALFAGDDQYIVDYLVEEVLNHQPAEMQNFLLQTSILNRMSGSLCDTVTGGSNGQAKLETLQQANLFVIPLDTKRRWFRYHHLFGDLLRHRLLQQDAQRSRRLHLRAAHWYLAHGDPAEAVHHALESHDEAGIEQVLIEATKQRIVMGQHHQVLRWFNRLPEALRLNRYRLTLFEGYLHIFLSQTAQVRAIVSKAIAQMPADAPPEAHGMLAGLQGFLADEDDDLTTAMALYEAALRGLAPEYEVVQNALRTLLGLAQLRTGSLESGFQLIIDAFQYSLQPDNLRHTLNSLVSLSSLFRRKAGPGLEHALRERIVAEYEAAETEPPPDLCWIYSALAQEHYYRNDLKMALKYTQKGIDIGLPLGPASPAYLNAQALLVNIFYALGRQGEADTLLAEITRTAQQVPEPMPMIIASVKILFLLKGGDIAGATALANRLGLSPQAPIAPILDYTYLIYARLLIAQAAHDAANAVLQRLAEIEENLGHPNRRVTVAILRAHQAQQSGDHPTALRYLEQAVQLGAAHGYPRLFLDEDAAIADLLPQVREVAPAFVDGLLAAFNKPTPTPDQPLIEPLTECELEVLRLVTAGQSNQQIADELVVTVGTVKKHLSNIFGKLGVNSRTQAVAEARALGIL